MTSTCPNGHKMEIVAEGFGLCYSEMREGWAAWAFSPPIDPRWRQHSSEAWVGPVTYGISDHGAALLFIANEIAARNANPEAITLTPGDTYEEWKQKVNA